MLDIEQNDQNDQNDNQQTGQHPEPGTQPAAPPRRRRAATRPAGPPAVSVQPASTDQPSSGGHGESAASGPAPSDTMSEDSGPAADVPAEAAPAAKKTAKRAPRKAAAAKTEGTAPRAPRKRAAKKTAATPPAEEAPADQPSGDQRPAEVAAVGGPGPDGLGEVAAPESAVVAESPVAPESPATPADLAPAEAALLAAVEGATVGDASPAALPVEGPGVEDWLPTEEAAQTSGEPGAPADVHQQASGEPAAEGLGQPGEEAIPAAPAGSESGEAQPDDAQPGEAQPGEPQPGEAQPGHARDELGEVSGIEPTDGEGAEAESSEVAEADSAEAESAEAESAEGEVAGAEGSDEEASGEEDTEDEEADDGSEGERDSDEEPTRRRRRRRGGRRRRRGSGGGESQSDGGPTAESGDQSGEQVGDEQARHEQAAQDATAPAESDDETAEASGDEDQAEVGDDSGGGEGPRRRRRRRRRRGEDSGSSPDDPADVVVRVREPASRRRTSEEPAGIEGSTRLEAKRQRRREGREAGRRRAPILSEAEFLARREAVKRAMIIRQRTDPSAGSGGSLTQIAVLEDDILVEHYVDRDSAASLIGNVYLGRVQNVLPSMEAAFIDIGRGRNAVLYAGEVDWDSFGAEGQARKVEKVLKSGQTVLVQVTKDPVGAKGARLTNHVSIPGRYIVYAPGGHLSGISRKLPDTERKRLKDILADLVPESASVIVRTAAEGATEDELVRDVNRLKAQWEDIERKVKAGQAPQLLYGEPDLTLRIVRDLFTEDFSELLVAGNNGAEDAYDAIEAYVAHVAPHLADRLKRWAPEDETDIFAAHRIDEQIAKALERKVFLPSGGSLIIDRTEAMTVIDVNTGKFTGTGGNLEATVTSNNLEAAEEIVRQLRLRDIGGIIVIDFIDMVLPSNRELLLRRLVECLGRDRTRHQVAEVTSLGLVQMTRKKIGTGLLEAFSTECEVCHGRGYEIHDVPVESQKQADGGIRDRGGNRRGRPRGGKGQGFNNSNDGGSGNGGGSKDSGHDHADGGGDHDGDRPAERAASVS